MRKIAGLALLLLLPLMINNSFASITGSINEIISNEKMEIYAVSVKETDFGEQGISVDVELILKNLEDRPRAFNPFFAKVIDTNGNEWKASPLLGTVMPIRIAPNDILRGVLAFPITSHVDVSMLVWEEFDGSELSVDLTNVKSPADPMPKSDFELSSNKGRILSDGITQITVHDELLNKSPRYYHVDVSIKNLGSEPLSYNFGFSFVKDQDGYMYPTFLENFQYLNNPLKRGELEQGEEVRGEILFPLSDTVTDVMLIYDERFGGGSYFAVPEFDAFALMAMVLSVAIVLVVSRFRKVG